MALARPAIHGSLSPGDRTGRFWEVTVASKQVVDFGWGYEPLLA